MSTVLPEAFEWPFIPRTEVWGLLAAKRETCQGDTVPPMASHVAALRSYSAFILSIVYVVIVYMNFHVLKGA